MTIGTDGIISDDADRVLVNILVNGQFSYDGVRDAVSAVPGVSITAEDKGV